MNDQRPTNPREQLEVRITALLLGEASAFEEAELLDAIKADSELEAFYEAMRRTVKQVEGAVPMVATNLELSGDRRSNLNDLFKRPTGKTISLPAGRARRLTQTQVILSIAAALVILLVAAGLLLPALAKAKAKAARITAMNEAKSIELSARFEEENRLSGAASQPASPGKAAENSDDRGAKSDNKFLARYGSAVTSPKPRAVPFNAAPPAQSVAVAEKPAAIYLPAQNQQDAGGALGLEAAASRQEPDQLHFVFALGNAVNTPVPAPNAAPATPLPALEIAATESSSRLVNFGDDGRPLSALSAAQSPAPVVAAKEKAELNQALRDQRLTSAGEPAQSTPASLAKPVQQLQLSAGGQFQPQSAAPSAGVGGAVAVQQAETPSQQSIFRQVSIAPVAGSGFGGGGGGGGGFGGNRGRNAGQPALLEREIVKEPPAVAGDEAVRERTKSLAAPPPIQPFNQQGGLPDAESKLHLDYLAAGRQPAVQAFEANAIVTGRPVQRQLAETPAKSNFDQLGEAVHQVAPPAPAELKIRSEAETREFSDGAKDSRDAIVDLAKKMADRSELAERAYQAPAPMAAEPAPIGLLVNSAEQPAAGNRFLKRSAAAAENAPTLGDLPGLGRAFQPAMPAEAGSLVEGLQVQQQVQLYSVQGKPSTKAGKAVPEPAQKSESTQTRFDALALNDDMGVRPGLPSPNSRQPLPGMGDAKLVGGYFIGPADPSAAKRVGQIQNSVQSADRPSDSGDKMRANAAGEFATNQIRLAENSRQNGSLSDAAAQIAEGLKVDPNNTRLQELKQMNDRDLDQAKTPATPPPPTLEPLPEISTKDNPFSTFSLNVSDVSFQLAATSLANGQMPDGARLRSEEFINAFNYHDPLPATGQRVAFAWDRARNPFAHNRDLLRFSVETAAAGREPGQPLNIVLLLDNSGSMERADRVRITQQMLRVLAADLTGYDRVSVIAFARTPRLIVDGMTGGNPEAFLHEVIGLNPDGGTNLEDAMKLGYETAAKHFLAHGNNRVILITDGAANLGNVDPQQLRARVVEQRKKGIALDCFGVGWEGYNDDLLEQLSRNGDGRYGFLNDAEQAPTQFAAQLAGALQVAAADVKAQVEFNPNRVTVYRQIGYQQHQLTKEQFRDNTVDAAEIGAAEAGNALYSVEINPNGSGPIGTFRVRYRVPSTGQYEEKEWPLEYAPDARDLASAPASMRLASSAAAFAEWLANSPYAQTVTPDALQNLLRGVPEAFAPDPRPAQLQTMIQQARSISGK
jgi:Mg-chelatase subunit ChlD